MSPKAILLVFITLVVAIAVPYYAQRSIGRWIVHNGYLPMYTDMMISAHCLAKAGSSPVDQIDDFLFLGDLCGARNLKALQSRNVTRVLNTCAKCPNKHVEELEYKHLLLQDIPEEDILVHLDDALSFIDDGVNKGEGVFVHCAQGRSRSATFVVAYFMKKNKWDYDKALEYVRWKRPIVEPNEGFAAQLRQFEALVSED